MNYLDYGLVSLPASFFIALFGLCVTANGVEHEIQLDLQNTGQAISPLLFGHNIEVTRRGIWSGLSAEMVANRKFAAVVQNMPTRWQAINVDCQVSIDDTVSYVGKQSACINVKTSGNATGIIQQQAFLAFRKDNKYAIRAWLKTETERKIHVQLVGANEEKPFFHKEQTISAGDWQLLDEEFISSVTEENCRLEITSNTEGLFWIGAVSIKPTDAILGMRRDVIELLKAIKPGCLRYPGGCYAEFYEWQEGLLPVDQRSPLYNTGLDFLFRDTDDTDNHEVGIDEFIALCREVGCEPVITVRLSENTPENAAALVEYCNGNKETKWGKIRAERGYLDSYNVKYWFLGNEIWAFGRGNARGAEGCAEQSKLLAQAMKKVDANIKLVACTVFDSGDAKSDWNKPLLESFGDLIYACSAHKYILDQLSLKTDDDIATIAKSPNQNIYQMLQTARDFIDKKKSADSKIGITFDEWNTLWGNSGSIAMGLYTASMLNMLFRNAESLGIEMACYFMPINEGVIKITPLTAEFDSAGYVFDLFKVHQGNTLLKIPETDSNSDINVCASINPDNKMIYATLVNRSIKTEYTVTLSLDNHVIMNPAATINYLIPNTLTIKESIFQQRTEKATITENHQIKLMLPPGSIARVNIQ